MAVVPAEPAEQNAPPMIQTQRSPRVSFRDLCRADRKSCRTMAQDSVTGTTIIQQQVPSVIFVGSTGAGKSTLCNFLHDLGEGHFEFVPAPIDSHQPQTQETVPVVIQVKNSVSYAGTKITLIDTPGLNESIERDLDHMKSLYKTIRKIENINAIALVIPFNFKVDMQWLATMTFFRDAFLPLFVHGHACLAVTHMSKEDYQNAQDDIGFEDLQKKTLAEVNKMLGLLVLEFVIFIVVGLSQGREITAIFCLNASLSKKSLQKAKTLVEHPEKQKDNWISRCLNTRENILGYICAKEAVCFDLPTFPLPPSFDDLRVQAIAKLEAREAALMTTLSSSNSVLNQQANQLSSLNSTVEALKVKIYALEQNILEKKEIQHTLSIFKSGDRTITFGRLAAQTVTLKSPSSENTLAFVLHNCTLTPLPDAEITVGSSIEVTIVPNWFAFKTMKKRHKKHNWFAQVWLEYSGALFFADEIEKLQTSRISLLEQYADIEVLVQELNEKMHATSAESSSISSTLNDIHFLRDFLKRPTFPLSDFRKLRKAHPLDDFVKLKACILNKTSQEPQLSESSKPETVQIQETHTETDQSCSQTETVHEPEQSDSTSIQPQHDSPPRKRSSCSSGTKSDSENKESDTGSGTHSDKSTSSYSHISSDDSNDDGDFHCFEPTRFNRPTWCDFCTKFVKNPFGTQGFTCTKCLMKIHKKCLEFADRTPCTGKLCAIVLQN